MTESDYLNGSVSLLRNPVLANVFFRLRYIEQFGTGGVARMLAAYEGTARSPSFEIREGSIRVSLPAVDSIVPMDTDEERVYTLIGTGTTLSRPQISELAGFGKDKTIRILGKLEAKGLVRKMGARERRDTRGAEAHPCMESLSAMPTSRGLGSSGAPQGWLSPANEPRRPSRGRSG